MGMSVFPDFGSALTSVPDAAVGTVKAYTRGGKPRFVHVLPLDIEIMRLILAAKYVRSVHASGWTGASISYVNARIRFLKDMGFIEPMIVSANFPDQVGGGGKWRPSTVRVWRLTAKGFGLLEPWQVVGAPVGYVSLPAVAKPRNTLGNHTLAALDAAVVFRRWGFEVAFEREYKAVEVRASVKGGGAAVLEPVWCTPGPAGGLHAPDLGVVHPDGSRWRVELELTSKQFVSDYVGSVRSMFEAGDGQVWLAGSEQVVRNVGSACAQLGLPLREFDMGPGVPPVFADDSFRVRVQRFRGGFAPPSRVKWVPELWDSLVSLGVPGGFAGVSQVGVEGLRRSWSRR